MMMPEYAAVNKPRAQKQQQQQQTSPDVMANNNDKSEYDYVTKPFTPPSKTTGNALVDSVAVFVSIS